MTARCALMFARCFLRIAGCALVIAWYALVTGDCWLCSAGCSMCPDDCTLFYTCTLKIADTPSNPHRQPPLPSFVQPSKSCWTDSAVVCFLGLYCVQALRGLPVDHDALPVLGAVKMAHGCTHIVSSEEPWDVLAPVLTFETHG